MSGLPFVYSSIRHVPRHGPVGYTDYRRYCPWLRDEFTFRCVYCLKREQWGIVRGAYSLDHFRPQAHHPETALDYNNLLYACLTCNSAKGDQLVPNPCDCMLDGQVVVHEDGRILATTPDAETLIRVLGLDDAEYREFRRLWIDIVALARERKPVLYQRLMQHPNDLPDLSKLRPPENSRPQGVQESYLARRNRGELPDIPIKVAAGIKLALSFRTA